MSTVGNDYIDDIANVFYSTTESQTYASSPEGSIRSAVSEVLGSSPSFSSDELNFADNLLGTIVRVKEDSLEKTKGSNSKRRKRTTFSSQQLHDLEQLFKKSKFLCGPKRKIAATKLGLEERQIKVWFQNRREKQKKLDQKNNAGNSGIFSAHNDGKKGTNQLTVKEEEDAKSQRMNTSAGIESTVHHHHHHLQNNIQLNTNLFDSYFPNTVNYQTTYSVSQQTGNINYTESYNYGNYNTNVYNNNNNNNYCYPTNNGINNNQTTYDYFSQPEHAYVNYKSYENNYTTTTATDITAGDLDLYAIGDNQTLEQNLNFSTKSESFNLFDDIDAFDILRTELGIQ